MDALTFVIALVTAIVGAGIGAWLLQYIKTKSQISITEHETVFSQTVKITDELRAECRELRTRVDAERGQCYTKLEAQRKEFNDRLDSSRKEWSDKNQSFAKDVHDIWVEKSKLEVDNARLAGELKTQTAELRLVQSTIQRLQQKTGDVLQPTGLPMLVVADLTGRILELNEACGPMFHYLKKDLIGKNIKTLIPERFWEAHDRGLAYVAKSGTPPWTERTISSYAKTKEGVEKPVSLILTGWQTPKGEWMISADIRLREEGSLVKDAPVDNQNQANI